MSERTAPGESAEMYLKTIYELAAAEAPVPIAGLAQRLGISPVSATEMVHRMEDQALVEHEPYRGVHLTEGGRLKALAVLRRHRLWECFLHDRLGLPWEEVHGLACLLEHAVGPHVTEALAVQLGQPKTCPHGNPIPTTLGELPPQRATHLDELVPGQEAEVVAIQPESELVLQHLAERGIKPGRRLTVLQVEPFDDLRRLSVDEQETVIGVELARHILVRPIHTRRIQDQERP